MTIPKIDIRHFVLESIEATAFYRSVRAVSTKRSHYSFRRSINGATWFVASAQQNIFSETRAVHKAICYSQHVR